MIPKVIIRETNIPRPPGLNGEAILARMIARSILADLKESAAARKEVGSPAAGTRDRAGRVDYLKESYLQSMPTTRR